MKWLGLCKGTLGWWDSYNYISQKGEHVLNILALKSYKGWLTLRIFNFYLGGVSKIRWPKFYLIATLCSDFLNEDILLAVVNIFWQDNYSGLFSVKFNAGLIVIGSTTFIEYLFCYYSWFNCFLLIIFYLSSRSLTRSSS